MEIAYTSLRLRSRRLVRILHLDNTNIAVICFLGLLNVFTLTPPPFPEFTDDGNLRERHERDYILYIHSVVYVNVSSIYSEIYTRIKSC